MSETEEQVVPEVNQQEEKTQKEEEETEEITKEDEQVEKTSNAEEEGEKVDEGKKSSLTDSQAKTLKEKQLEEKRIRKKELDDEFISERQIAIEADKAGKVIVNVQVCIDCPSHSYCTHHSEKRYKEMFVKLREEVRKLSPTIEVVKNCGSKWPEIGAFEVQFKNTILYSKLDTKLWPRISIVAKKIVNHIKKENNGEKENAGPTKAQAAKNVADVAEPVPTQNTTPA